MEFFFLKIKRINFHPQVVDICLETNSAKIDTEIDKKSVCCHQSFFLKAHLEYTSKSQYDMVLIKHSGVCICAIFSNTEQYSLNLIYT